MSKHKTPPLQYLEEHHMLHQFKRFAGASAGAITSALVALGYSSKEIYDFLSDNIEEIFLGKGVFFIFRFFFWRGKRQAYSSCL